MGKSPKAPKPMDVDTVTGQANDQNTNNAYKNAAFNRLNQTDQFGNTLNYNQTGTDANGNPIFGVTQGMGEAGKTAAAGFGGMADKYYGMAGAPIESSMDAMNRAYDSATAFSEPRMQRQMEQERTRLTNMGLDPSSAAYKNGVTDLTENQSNSRNTLAAALQGQMFNQGLAGRQQQMNELSPGLQYGMGAMRPNMVNTPGVGVQNVDVAGLHSQAKGQEWQGYNAQMQSRNAMLGGLGGIAGSVLSGGLGGLGGLGGMLGGMMKKSPNLGNVGQSSVGSGGMPQLSSLY